MHQDTKSIRDAIERLRPAVQRTLAGFTTDDAWKSGLRYVQRRPDRDEFPVPELALFVLREVMGCKWFGTGEKVRWTVCCSFQGKAVSFSLRKFGFEADFDASLSNQDIAIAMKRLRKAVALAEKGLARFPELAAEKGEVALANRYGRFNMRYRFFRVAADRHFANGKLNRPESVKDESPFSLAAVIGNFMEDERAASFLSAAMVDAYFSRIEHELVLMLPFLGFDSSNGNLLNLIRSDWDVKFKAVLDIHTDREAKRLYDELRALKERIRNPMAHGGFEKGWWSLHFLLDGVGAIPGNLCGIADSIQFDFIEIDERSHSTALLLFDAVDQHLERGDELSKASDWVRGGMNVWFDAESVREYRTAMTDDDTWSKYVERQARLTDMHANMDY